MGKARLYVKVIEANGKTKTEFVVTFSGTKQKFLSPIEKAGLLTRETFNWIADANDLDLFLKYPSLKRLAKINQLNPKTLQFLYADASLHTPDVCCILENLLETKLSISDSVLDQIFDYPCKRDLACVITLLKRRNALTTETFAAALKDKNPVLRHKKPREYSLAPEHTPTPATIPEANTPIINALNNLSQITDEYFNKSKTDAAYTPLHQELALLQERLTQACTQFELDNNITLLKQNFKTHITTSREAIEKSYTLTEKLTALFNQLLNALQFIVTLGKGQRPWGSFFTQGQRALMIDDLECSIEIDGP